MAGRGPAPKGSRARDRDTPKFETLEDTGVLYGTDLPEGVLPADESWHPQTVRWWNAIRKFPLLKDEPDIGWQFLIDTALMHHTMWTKGKWEFAAEIRLRVAKYGATPEDRMRLKITVEKPDADTEPELEAPPRTGRGSTIDAWRTYAAAVGATVAKKATKADIIAAVDALAQNGATVTSLDARRERLTS